MTPIQTIQLVENQSYTQPFEFGGLQMGSLTFIPTGTGTLSICWATPPDRHIDEFVMLGGVRLSVLPPSIQFKTGSGFVLDYTATATLFQGYGGVSILGSVNLLYSDGSYYCDVPISIDPPGTSPRLIRIPLLMSSGFYFVGFGIAGSNAFSNCAMNDEAHVVPMHMEMKMYFPQAQLGVTAMTEANSNLQVSTLTTASYSPPRNMVSAQYIAIHLVPDRPVQATLTLPYNLMELQQKGFSEDDLQFVFWNNKTNNWEPLKAPPVLDKIKMTISQDTTHFSVWTLVATKDVPATDNIIETNAPEARQPPKDWWIAILVAVLVIIAIGLSFCFMYRKRRRLVGQVTNMHMELQEEEQIEGQPSRRVAAAASKGRALPTTTTTTLATPATTTATSAVATATATAAHEEEYESTEGVENTGVRADLASSDFV
eukprot:gb/GEZN01007062.1/.p1 GENE.gb/GEZN01007062.1/~~gb/GEZN01007062.1/.p1  ORF type:complete len:502 (+),score=61.42 gb/GEZN01007062.1/:222-1508(+)